MDQQSALLDLLGLLDLDPLHDRGEREYFRGPAPLERSAPVYGGHVAAQALAAAGRTVSDGLAVHSVHASFTRPAVPDAPFEHRVESVKDSRAFATRRVCTSQRGREVFALTSSFHRPEPGLAHQAPMPPAPAPEGLPTYEERLAKAFGAPVAPLGKPYDQRFVGPLSFDVEKDPALASARTQVWLRTKGELPPGAGCDREQLLHACLLVYICDVTMLETVLVRHGVSWFHASGRSIDYTVWIHHPFRADDWLLCDHESPVAAGGRGLVLGRVFTRDGILAATLAQEGLLRVSGGHGQVG